MKTFTFTRHGVALLAFMLLSLAAIQPASSAEAGKDHPLVGRYEGSKMDKYKQSEFDEIKLLKNVFDVKANDFTAENSLVLQGKTTSIRYIGPKGRSALEVAKNYETSLLTKGFETVFSCANEACMSDKGKWFHRLGGLVDGKGGLYQKSVRHMLMKLTRPEGDVYVTVTAGEWNSEPAAFINVVELKPMETNKIAFVDASKMESDIAANGKVALYGILFDTGSDKLKAESVPTLTEIAKLLKQQPSLNLVVTGHTDNQGEFAFNVDLSNKRASAVKAALIGKYNIAASRLTSFGAGMAAPVASNSDDSGRSKNRRVELVKR